MSGLLALLDDVAAIAKVAAASVDDVVGQATKAGAKAAGALIDDAAVTPKYVHGFDASRELPIVGRIALGSIRNKLLILLPAGLALSAFAPWAISPLLMLGGAYLCFEGAEKVFHKLFPHADAKVAADMTPANPEKLEETRVAGAIKTDFILSAEIMTIALAAIPPGSIWLQAATLAVVAVGITALVYGAVALIVKADDLGMLMARAGRLRVTRIAGRSIVAGIIMAMLWVGGNIVIHGADVLGFPLIYDWISERAKDAAALVGRAGGAVRWTVTATLDGVFGLALGVLLIPLATRVIGPVWARAFGGKA